MEKGSSVTVATDPYLSTESIDNNSACSTSALNQPTVSSARVVSLLDKLKRPSPSEIARERRIKSNKPPLGQRKCRGQLVSDPKRISPQQRVQEFSSEPFAISHGRFFVKHAENKLAQSEV